MDIFWGALVLSLCYLPLVARSWDSVTPTNFDVVNFGAVGNGIADDTAAFLKAWNATCTSTSVTPTMIVPNNKIFLVKTATFQGPCKSSSINFQIHGKIIAPDSPSAWAGIDASTWLQFNGVNGLTVTGPGEINGRGYNWWKQSCRYNPKLQGCTSLAPNAMKFISCDDLRVSQLTLVDSAQVHILILLCHRVGVDNVTITAPGTSPNTDGIHIHGSQHVTVEDASIGAGDDCISIGDQVYDIVTRRINCGPGHGISIGSLGLGGTEAKVEEVHVEHANFVNTTNGARIKTWQGGKGYARGISFEHCTFNNVENPIIIDQYYCDVRDKCKAGSTNVKISNVTYVDFQGTSKYPFAVSVNCSQATPCTAMQFDTVNLTLASGSGLSLNTGASSADTKAYCINAHGNTKGYIHPDLSCLLH